MEKRKVLEKSIAEQCLENNSILELLRHQQFDTPKYRKLYHTIRNYYETLKGQNAIDRQTVGYLKTLDETLLAALLYYQSKDNKSEIHRQLQEAYNEVMDIMNAIYFGE